LLQIALTLFAAHQEMPQQQHDVDSQSGAERAPERHLELQISPDKEGRCHQRDGPLHDEIGNAAMLWHSVLAVFDARHGRVTTPPCRFVDPASFSLRSAARNDGAATFTSFLKAI
jgi:hypothetical protein